MTLTPAPARSEESSADPDDSSPKIRPPRLEYGDGEAMWRIARTSGVLEENAEYTYHMFTHFFRDACVVAEVDGQTVGFIAGFRPPDRADTVFVWQIAVDDAHRGHGLASAMLHGLLAQGGPVRYVEATVTPSNEPSKRTFRRLARALDAPCTETVLFPGERFGGPSHEDEILFRIGPADPERAMTDSPALIGARR